MIGKTVSHYRILEELGRGGMGIVYKAEDLKLKRTVALKFLPHHLLVDEEDKTRLLHEAQAASALSHPNIMTIYEIDEVDDPATAGRQTFISMELVEGETLNDKLEKGSLRTKELLNIAIAVAEGLNAAHEKEIVHRDIKPENIMISPKRLVKIMDFGIAKRKGVSGITEAGATPGTLAYMSPEQTEGLEVDHRSDLFSFGAVMYEMATGQLPFKGEHDAAILYSIVNETAPAVNTLNPDIPPELERIISKSLEKEPEDRYQHADDLGADLRKLKKDLETGRKSITPAIPVPKAREKEPVRGVPALIVVAAVVVVLMIFGIRSLLMRGAEPVAPLQENSLAVLYFENLKDPEDSERMGQIVQELIIADLSEIRTLKVFSSQRLFDIQKQLGSRERRKIDRELATEIARRAGAETMLTGNLIQASNRIILTSQLVDASEGAVLESQRVEGNDIYAMVDDLSDEIRKDLDLRTSGEDRVDIAVKEKTTSFVDAYQLYFAGVDLLNDSKFDSAVAKFQTVVAIDNAFGQAYYKMAIAQWWSQSTAGEATSEQAIQSLQQSLSGRVYTSTKEKFMAEGALALIKQRWDEAQGIYQQLVDFVPDEKEAWYGLGEAYFHGIQDLVKALGALEQVIKLDPEFTLAYRHIFDVYTANELFDRGLTRAIQLVALNPEKAWGHFYLGKMFRGKKDHFKALEAFERAVELDPGFIEVYSSIFDIYIEEDLVNQGIQRARRLVALHPSKPWPHNFLGIMHRTAGNSEQALDAFQKGVSINPGAYNIIDNMGYTYQLMGRYDKAVETFSWLTVPEAPLNRQAIGTARLASVHTEQGQYRRAIKLTEERLVLSKSLGIDDEASALINSALLHHFLGDSVTVLARLDDARVLKPSLNNLLFSYWVEGMMRSYRGQEKALAVVLDTVQSMVTQETGTSQMRAFQQAIEIEYLSLRGEFDKALAKFHALSSAKGLQDIYLYKKALLHLRKGNYDTALALADTLQSHTISKDVHHYAYPMGFYVRGLAYEEMGNPVLARENYERLLSLWREGDEEIRERQDTIRRLSQIIRVLG